MSTLPTISPEKLEEFERLVLHSGGHNNFEQGHCAMEVVSWLADEGFTDAPECASPVLRRYVIRLNDRWDNEKRQTLKPYLLRMIGTGGDGKDALREQIAARHVTSLLTPWLRLAGHWAVRNAAYKAAREHYDANPLPIAQEIADLAASQQGVALDLLDKMIDPEVQA